MSPRRADPRTRVALMEAAARLLDEEGATALSARRVAAEVGASTMAVYTHFGSMDDLVRGMVHEAFARLAGYMGSAVRTDDPVTDVSTLGRAYRRNALANRHLYAVMLGGSTISSFSLTDEDRQHGRYTLDILIEAVVRCIQAGRFREEDPALVAHHMWIAMHGLVVVELGGYLVPPYDADTIFEEQLVQLMVGAGDEIERARRSVARSAALPPHVEERAGGA